MLEKIGNMGKCQRKKEKRKLLEKKRKYKNARGKTENAGKKIASIKEKRK